MFLRRVFLALLALMFIAPLARADVAFPANTTLIILRHADRDGENLTAKGEARAEALVEALAGMQIDAIFSPGIKRNLDTAAPLAAARGLRIKRIPAKNPTKRLMRRGGGKTIVWIGNKGNLRSIWKNLGAPGPAPLEYGDLFIVTADGSALNVTRRHFGP